MTLEPVMPALDEEENPELRDFARRFWWSLPLTVVVTVLAMAGHSLQLLPWLSSKLDRVRSGDTGDLMGRLALFCKGTWPRLEIAVQTCGL
jgi:P-type Cu+ transporter